MWKMVSLLIIKSEKINLTHIKHVTVTLNKYYGTLVLILNFFNVLRKVIGEVYKKLNVSLNLSSSRPDLGILNIT